MLLPLTRKLSVLLSRRRKEMFLKKKSPGRTKKLPDPGLADLLLLRIEKLLLVLFPMPEMLSIQLTVFLCL